MSSLKSMGEALESAVTDHIDKLEHRDKYHQRKIKALRRIIKDLRRQVKEFSSYVNSGKQQIDMIKLAQVAGKFEREPHLLEIIKMVPEIKHALCENLQYLLPWAHPGWVGKRIDIATGEDYAAACIALERLIMDAGMTKFVPDGDGFKEVSIHA